MSMCVYIYIYKYVCIYIYIYIYIYANFIKHNRHFMSTYFLLDPFEFPYYFYCILGELIYVLSIVACIPSAFCPTLGHHQGRIYYKSDVTFVLAYYKGHLLIPNNIDKFINLSDWNLTPQQKDFLNLGPNCHLFQGYTSINKNTEIEISYQNISKLRDNKVISVKPEFRYLLKAEAIKNRYNKKQPTLLTHQLKTAAKELRNHPNITIKKS